MLIRIYVSDIFSFFNELLKPARWLGRILDVKGNIKFSGGNVYVVIIYLTGRTTKGFRSLKTPYQAFRPLAFDTLSRERI